MKKEYDVIANKIRTKLPKMEINKFVTNQLKIDLTTLEINILKAKIANDKAILAFKIKRKNLLNNLIEQNIDLDFKHKINKYLKRCSDEIQSLSTEIDNFETDLFIFEDNLTIWKKEIANKS